MENQIKYAELLNMFGSNILNKDNSDVGTALVKFSALTEDLSILQKTLVSHFISDFFYNSHKAF